MTPPPDPEYVPVSDVLAGRGLRFLPEGSFLRSLAPRPGLWQSMVPLGQTRQYSKGEPLTTGGPGEPVHIVISGCVSQQRGHFGTSILRFRGGGQVLEEQRLLDPEAPGPTTTCLSETVTLGFAPDALWKFFARHVAVERKLLLSLEIRNRTDERIYSTFKRTALARVSTLLHHLGATVGVRDQGPYGGVRIDGPSQYHLTEALQLGQSTVEQALGQLREEEAIHNRYRAIVVRDMAALAVIARRG